MSIKLLLADDSITIQKVVGIIFGGEDYSLTVVDNGKAAVEKACELCPDVLLIDALMPGMTGYEVCEAVRATPALATKPILILTGSFEPFDEEKMKKCGADGFLAKPFESQQIINRVKELADLGALRAAEAAAPKDSIETLSEPVAPLATPVDTITEPETSPPQPETSQSTAPSDIWGAFTTDDVISANTSGEPESFDTTGSNVAEPEPVDTLNSDDLEPDVFAIVNEDPDSQLVQLATEPSLSDQNTGTEWIPVEEHTYEFEEEQVADLPQDAFSELTTAVQDPDFGEIAFVDEAPDQKPQDSTAKIDVPSVPDFMMPEPEMESFTEPPPSFEPAITAFETPAPVFEAPVTAPETVAPVFEAPVAAPETVAPVFEAPVAAPETPAPVFETPVTVPETVAPVFEAPVAAPETVAPDFAQPVSPATSLPVSAGALSEEQLKAAILSASKEVIERIVWEVVPDLAEVLIQEAIRKIKEGV